MVVVIFFPHLFWLERAGFESAAGAQGAAEPVHGRKAADGMGQSRALAAVQPCRAGGAGDGRGRRARRKAHRRARGRARARRAVRQGLSCISSRSRPRSLRRLLAVLTERTAPIGGAGPLVVLSGLAVVVAAGDMIRLYRERISALVWLGLLVVPPAVIIAATVTLPWTAAVDLEVSKPANAMGQFFTDTFRRRTGRPLAIVVGDVRTAGLVALASPDRPSLYIDGSPALSPWISDDDVREKGAVIVWPVTDASGTPPPALEGALPRHGRRKCRARSSDRCRDGCRCCASAGRWCGRGARRPNGLPRDSARPTG